MVRLVWVCNDTHIVFSCKEGEGLVPVEQWGCCEILTISDKPGSVGPLLLSVEDELSDLLDENHIQVPHSTIASFESYQLRQVGLPEISSYRLHIHGDGNLAQSGFKFLYHFSDLSGRPLMGWKRQGALLLVGSKSSIINEPIFSLVDRMDAYNIIPEEDLEARFLLWGELKNILPDDVVVDDYLNVINVAPADAFTMHVTNLETLEFDPVLVRGEVSISNTDIPAEKTKSFDKLLPDAHQDSFSRMFWQGGSVRKRYSVGDGWFVAIPETLQRALSVAHSYKDRSPEERRAFLANPRQVLAKHVGDHVAEDVLENLLYESPEFLSERIKYLGKWHPKAGVFLLPSEQDWLAGGEELGIPIGDSIVRVPIKELPKLLEQVKAAQEAGKETVDFRGQKIPATEEAIKALSLNLPELQPSKDDKDKKETSPDEKEELLVPIIIDHLDEIGFERKIVTRPGTIGEVPEGLTSSLLKHQRKGLRWLQENWTHGRPGCLLADDMGLGKTFQTLAFLSWVKNLMIEGSVKNGPMLIVAPTGLLKNWEEEVDKHLAPPGLGALYRAYGAGFRTLRSQAETNAAKELESFELVLTTYETLRDYIRIFIKIGWSVVTFDEVQKIKNPAALMTDMAKSLEAEFSIALTGTPIENRLADMWCIVDTVYPGKLQTLKEFSQKFESRDREQQATQCVELKRILVEEPPEIMLRRLKEDHLDGLPSKKQQVFHVPMPSTQAQAYQQALSSARSAIAEPGRMLMALQSLRSISLHPFTHPDGTIDDDYVNQSARLKATVEILDEISSKNEKALIFLESLDMQQMLIPYLQKRYQLLAPPMVINGSVNGPKRQARVKTFQDPGRSHFDVMILSPKAGGVGLTLTAANHVIHLSRWWNPAVEDQCSDRVYRIGQEKDVHIYCPLAVHPDLGDHSFDVNLNNLLDKKRQLSRDVLMPPAGSSEDMEALFNETIKAGQATGSESISLEQIDLLEPIAFENLVLAQLARNGYESKSTPVSGDYGADGIALAPRNSGKRNLIIQCKHTQTTKPCKEDAIYEVVKAIDHYHDLPRPYQAIVITNAQGFTAKAQSEAKSKDVRLIDRSQLIPWLTKPF